MPQKPSKCICYGKPRFRKGLSGWYMECACSRRTKGYTSTKDEAVKAWNKTICEERGAAHA